MQNTIRIIGVDPGLRRTGWGIIDTLGNSLRFVASGTVTSDGDWTWPRAFASCTMAWRKSCTAISLMRLPWNKPSSTRTPLQR